MTVDELIICMRETATEMVTCGMNMMFFSDVNPAFNKNGMMLLAMSDQIEHFADAFQNYTEEYNGEQVKIQTH